MVLSCCFSVPGCLGFWLLPLSNVGTWKWGLGLGTFKWSWDWSLWRTWEFEAACPSSQGMGWKQGSLRHSGNTVPAFFTVFIAEIFLELEWRMVEIISLKMGRHRLAELPSEGDWLHYGTPEPDLYPRHWSFLCIIWSGEMTDAKWMRHKPGLQAWQSTLYLCNFKRDIENLAF